MCSLKKIVLKPLSANSISEKYLNWLGDETVNRYLEIRHNIPKSVEEIKDFIHQCDLNKKHHWGIFINHKHIGNVSCSAYSYLYRWVGISIIIGEKDFWHKGIAKSALAGAIDHLVINKKFHRVQAGVYSNNISSIKLFEALGFKREAVFRESAIFDDKFIDVIKLGLLEEDWMRKRESISKAQVEIMNWE